jgi:hypothetical protein
MWGTVAAEKEGGSSPFEDDFGAGISGPLPPAFCRPCHRRAVLLLEGTKREKELARIMKQQKSSPIRSDHAADDFAAAYLSSPIKAIDVSDAPPLHLEGL